MWEPTQRLVELEEEHHHAINVFIEGVGCAHGDSQGHARGVVRGCVCASGRDVDVVGGVKVVVVVVVPLLFITVDVLTVVISFRRSMNVSRR